MIELSIFAIKFLFVVGNFINGNVYNSTDPVSLINGLNQVTQTGALNNQFGLGMMAIIFLIIFIVLSYRILWINALIVAGGFSSIITVFLNQLGLIPSSWILVFGGITILALGFSLVRGILNPYSSE